LSHLFLEVQHLKCLNGAVLTVKKAKFLSYGLFVNNHNYRLWILKTIISGSKHWSFSRNFLRLNHLTSLCSNKSQCWESFSSNCNLKSHLSKLCELIELTILKAMSIILLIFIIFPHIACWWTSQWNVIQFGKLLSFLHKAIKPLFLPLIAGASSVVVQTNLYKAKFDLLIKLMKAW